MRHLSALFALIPLVFGLLLATQSMKAERSARASLGWPSVTGEIVNRNQTSTQGRKKLRVDYTYAVDGVAYKGRRLSFAANKADYPDWAKRFAPGTRIPVYYDPGSPATAVLVPGGESVARAIFWAGWGCVVFAAGLLWCHFRDGRTARPGPSA